MSESTSSEAQLPAIADGEISKIRARGAAELAFRREVNTLYRQLEGMEWGSGTSVVRGTSFSEHTRYALAQFCRVTAANPMVHVDILGGKPYLNATYWSDRITSDDLYHHLEQREISERSETMLRERAEESRNAAELVRETNPERAGELLSRALDFELEADQIADARRNYAPPPWATHVYETTIYRFVNAAPIDAIKAGELTPDEAEKWLVAVSECNWAGGRPRPESKSERYDPIGNAEPEKTARTRSLRRAAVRAFPAWLSKYETQVRRAEEAIEAEWEEVQDEMPRPANALITGAGEPEGTSDVAAEDLPGTRETLPREPEPEAESAPAESWNREATRRRYFASLRDAGIDDRKEWQRRRGLPESTSEWGRREFDTAIELLMAPVIDKYRDGCGALGVDPEDFALQTIGGIPRTLANYNELNEALESLAVVEHEAAS